MIIGTPSSLAFLFFEELEVISLLTRKAVFLLTEELTFPPRDSIFSLHSLRFVKWVRLPVITNVFPSKEDFFRQSNGKNIA